MVVLTVAAGGAVIAAPVVLPAAAATGASFGAGAGIGTAGLFAITATETAAAVAGAGAGGASAGFITGAIAGGSTAAAAAGTVTGAAAGAGVTSCISGGAGFAAAGIASGPAGWLLLGASSDEDRSITWDCWKPILHDESQEKSKGIFFKDIVNDPRITKVVIGNLEDEKCFPKITVMNNWDEQFDILPVQLPNGHLALHAELNLK